MRPSAALAVLDIREFNNALPLKNKFDRKEIHFEEPFSKIAAVVRARAIVI